MCGAILPFVQLHVVMPN